MKQKNKIIPWLFVLPALLSVVVLKYYPIMKAFGMSLYQYDLVNPPGKFVGFQNYQEILAVGFFWEAWRNTFVFLVLNLVIAFIPPLIQALFLNEITKGGKLFKVIYIIPLVIPVSVTVILWKWIWHPDYGIANMLTQAIGLGRFAWLNDPMLVKFCLVFPGLLGGGVGVFVYLAAIKGIPQDIFEAAEIDGASGWERMRYITLPNIVFTIKIQLIFMVMGVLQIMDLPYQMTHGGPANASATVALNVYEYAEKNMNYGYATAASFILMGVILVVTVLQVCLNKEEQN